MIADHDLVKKSFGPMIADHELVKCVCAYLGIHDCFIFSSRVHDRQSSDQNFSSRGHDRQSSEQNNQKLISLHNNGEVNKHAHRFADF
jgi:hypothetical protein